MNWVDYREKIMNPELIEAIKGAVQLAYLLMEMAKMDEKQQKEFLSKERERFKRNISEPLPDV